MKTLMQRLKEENLSCIVEQNHKVYTGIQHGILPILKFLEEGKLQDAIVADKVIGKAAAMMMVYGGVKSVDTLLISEHALAFFKAYKTPVSFEECVPYIINRKKDGMCPMEESVLAIENMEEAYHVLVKKTKQLQKMST